MTDSVVSGGTEDRGPWTLEHEDRLGELYAAEAELASVEAERDRLRAECVVHGARPAPEQPVEPEGDR